MNILSRKNKYENVKKLNGLWVVQKIDQNYVDSLESSGLRNTLLTKSLSIIAKF